MRYIATILLCQTLSAQIAGEVAFQATPRQLLDAARAAKAGDDDEAVILLDDHRYRFDQRGRLTLTHRQIISLRKAPAVESWGAVSVGWAPWHQERPRLEARVITPSGAVHTLDPTTIAESPERQIDASIFSDARVLQAPLPAMGEGAVIEWQSVVTETSPLLAAGVAFHVPIGTGTPTEHLRIAVDSEIPLTHAFRGVIPELKREGNRTSIRVSADQVAKTEFVSFLASAEESAQAYLAFSTGTTWKEISAAYNQIVERQIQSGGANSLLEGLEALPRREKIAAILHKIRESVRYTGVEFGEASIVPRTPSEVLERKYGDCKDKSALLVAALRKAGISAHVALLNVNGAVDTIPSLPGFRFDHAIVFIPGPDPIWIDATDDASRLGDLPEGTQGRFALIADGTAAEPVRLPKPGAERNLLKVTHRIKMADPGRAEVEEITEASGVFETRLRSAYRNLQGADLRKRLEFHAKTNLGEAEIKTVAKTADGDYRDPFRLRLEIQNSRLAVVEGDEGAVALAMAGMFAELPYYLIAPKIDTQRKQPAEIVLPLQYTFELRCEITIPPGFRTRPLPKSETRKLGVLDFSSNYETAPNGTIIAGFRLVVPRRRMTAVEAEETRAAVQKLNGEVKSTLLLLHSSGEQLAAGQWKEAIAQLRASAAQPAAAAVHHVRLGRAYLAIGAVDLARASAQRAIDLDDKSPLGHITLGYVLEHDQLGRLRHPGWQPEAAERSYRKSLELDNGNLGARLGLAILLEHNATGERYERGSRIDAAIAEYDKLLAAKSAPEFRNTVLTNRAFALLNAGKIDEFALALNQIDRSERGRNLSTIATALRETPAAAIVEVQRASTDPQQRARHLFGTALDLVAIRRYSQASELIRAAARLVPNISSQEVEFFTKMRRAEDSTAVSGPAALARTWNRMVVDGVPDESFLDRSLSRYFPKPLARAMIESAHQEWKSLGTWSDRVFDQIGANQSVRRDWALQADFQVDGEFPAGARLSPTGGSVLKAALVAREGSEYKLVAVDHNMAGAGRAALAALDAGDLEAAQHWLDWALAAPGRTEDQGSIPPTRALWSGVGDAGRSATVARAAAAAFIVAGDPTDAPAIKLLEAARLTEKLPALREPYDRILAEARIARGEFGLALPLAASLEARPLTKSIGNDLRTRALIGMKDWKQSEIVLLARVAAATPKPPAGAKSGQPAGIVLPDSKALRLLAESAASQGQWAKAYEWTTKLCDYQWIAEEDRIACGWAALAAGKEPRGKWLEELRTRQSSLPGRSLLLAAITVKDDPSAALNFLRGALPKSRASALQGPAIFVLSSILEAVGLGDEARQLRKTVSAKESPEFDWAEAAAGHLAGK